MRDGRTRDGLSSGEMRFMAGGREAAGKIECDGRAGAGD